MSTELNLGAKAPPSLNLTIDAELKERALRAMPAGMYGHESVRLLPEGYPQYFARSEGAYIWDEDGNRYLDFMCAYGPNLLGYRHPEVMEAVRAQMDLGDTMTGPSGKMVELAEKFTSIVSHADWAMFCKNGTDATTMAVTASRAQTGKRRVLVADGAYHGAAPWCTPLPSGIVPEERAFISKYQYNDVASLEAAVAEAGDDLAAIIATPFRHEAFENQVLPNPAYARRARELCDETGAMLVVDDVRAGFRLARDCSWELIGVRPDLSCWGKSFANGQPISALLGSDRCRDGAASIYVTGSFWFAAVPMAAALATLDIICSSDYLEHTVAMGTRLRNGIAEVAKMHDFDIQQSGPVQMPQILFGEDPDFRVGFAFSRAMVTRGFYIHPWHNMFMCAAMTADDIDATVDAADAALGDVRQNFSSLEPHPLVLMLLAQHG